MPFFEATLDDERICRLCKDRVMLHQTWNQAPAFIVSIVAVFWPPHKNDYLVLAAHEGRVRGSHATQ